MVKTSKIILFFLILSSCATQVETNIPMANIQISEHSFNLKNDINKTYTFNIGNKTLMAQSFSQISVGNQVNFIKDRKNYFLNLFKDDIDPYTGFNDKKSKCLVSQSENIVEFFAGKIDLLSHCLAKDKLNLVSNNAVRIWKICHNTVWELTLLKSDYELMKFSCLT